MKMDMGFRSGSIFAGILLTSGLPAPLFSVSHEDVQSHE